MPDSELSKLDSIRKKIRRLTNTPSPAQLPDTDIDAYVNSFVLYDMPTSVSLSSLRTVLRFYTEPYVDVYSTNTANARDPLYEFKNKYKIASNTIYVSGELSYFTSSRSDFYNKYPRSICESSIGTGDGVETNFTGTLSSIPVLSNNVICASIDLNDEYMKVYDDGEGSFSGDGAGEINYVTGEYDIVFSDAPKTGSDVYIQSYYYQASRPDTVLFYEDSFYLRPIPDKCYSVEVEVFKRPTELLESADLPDLSQWWEYIAYGAARKVLIDRADFDAANVLEQEMEKKREDVLYKSIIQNTIKEGYGV